MQNPSGPDYLATLRAELVEHLRRARAALEPVGSQAVGALGAAVCAAEVGQVLAVLRPLGLDLLGVLAEDLVRLAGALEFRPAAGRGDAGELLRHGIDQLRDGLERRAAGRPEGALALLAVVNELRAASGMPLASQTRLFASGLEAELARVRADRAAPQPSLAEAARAERVVLHRAMYLWFTGREPERALRKLRRVAQTMRRAAGTALVRRLFLLLEAATIAAAEGGGPPTQTLRRLLLQVDGLLKAGAEGGEAAVAAMLPVALMRNLLFQVASSGSFHRVVQAVRRSADLSLLTASGSDGRERLVPPLRAEVAHLQHLVLPPADGPSCPADALAEALRGLSDSLGIAQLGELRQRLDAPLDALARVPPGEPSPPEISALLGPMLIAIDGAICAVGGVAEPSAAAPPHGAPADAARVQGVSEPDAGLAADAGAIVAGELEALDEDIREVFLDEAAERVAALREAYVAWSAQPEDDAPLGVALRLLGDLKSTGRLVGAHTLSEICWVLQAALERCRDGSLPATEGVLAALDRGVETVDALVAAHLTALPITEDPRSVERKLYALLAASPEQIELLAPAVGRRRARPVGDGDTEDLLAASDLSVAEILADEAEDLVEILAEGLEGLARRPNDEVWLVEMRRALRSLAATARCTPSPRLAALSDACEAILPHGTSNGVGLDVWARDLVAEVLDALRAALGDLREGRSPAVPAGLMERLRGGRVAQPDAAAQSHPPHAAAAETESATGESRPLEEQVAALRDYVGRLEGIVARLDRAPQRSGADEADRARAVADLGPCADGLHAVSLAIDALVRGSDSG